MQNKLLQALVADGVLDERTASEIERAAGIRRVKVEQMLRDRNLVSDEAIAKLRAKQLKIPYREVTISDISNDILKLIPYDTVRTYRVFPIEKKGGLLTVGAEYPEDQAVQDALRYIAKQNRVDLGVYVVTSGAVNEVLKRYSPFQDEIRAAIQSINIRPGGLRGGGGGQTSVVTLEGDRTVVSGEAPIIKLVARFLKEAVAVKASDIHFEPERDRMRIRFRVDGELYEVASAPLEIHPAVISRLKIISKLKIDETRIPQDGRFRTELFDRDIDFRVATFPTPFGEKIELRVLDPAVGLRGLVDLGVSGKNLELLEKGIKKPYGLILVTGPTGSGKTTTIYALMQIINKPNVNIISLEDPVEYSISGVNQSQVQPEIGYTFASGLRQILRQDPDVIMIGEIRDKETAELATHAALTGHVVLTTLHTNNALGVIPRMIDLGVPSFLLSSTVNLMVAQRLVGRLCDNCKRPEDVSAEVLNIVRDELPEELRRKFGEKLVFYRSPGCTKCNNKGRTGRIAVAEVFTMTPELGEIITAHISEAKILEESKRQHMVTMRVDGIAKALEGLVSIEEVLRETSVV